MGWLILGELWKENSSKLLPEKAEQGIAEPRFCRALPQ
jgi:hypothetical protein